MKKKDNNNAAPSQGPQRSRPPCPGEVLMATGVDGRIGDALYRSRWHKAMSMDLVDKLVAATFAPPQDGRLFQVKPRLEKIAERLSKPLDEVMAAAQEFSSPRWGRYDWETRRLA